MQKTNFWKRLMSLFLALITVVGLLPLSAMVTPAQALTINGGTGPAPDTMTNNSHRTWKEYNSPTLKPSKVVPRIFDFKVGDLGVSPGFCADHSKGISWTVEWSDPVPITGTKYEVIMPLLAAYCQKWFYSRMLDELHPDWTVTQKKDQARQDLGARSYYYTEDDRVTASAFVQAAAWMAGAGQLTDLSDHAQQLLIARERNLTMETIYKHVNETDEEVAGWIDDSIQKYADGEYGQWEAYLYTPSGGLQPIITVLPPGPIEEFFGWIKIDKTDLSGKNLKGATFGIYTDSGHENKVAEFTTTDDEWTYYDVSELMTSSTQTFYLKEISAPPGYIASTSGYTVTVNSANNNTQDTAAAVNGGAPIKNSPVQKPEGVVQKVYLHDNPIGPAVFRFVSLDNKIDKKIRSDANGDLKLQWTDPDGENYLPSREYTVTEDIAAGRQVSFQYMEYGMDKKLHPRRELPYQVHPYGLCFANGNYYLICRYPGYDTLSHYRVDRIQNPVLTEESREPLPQGMDLSRYVRERVYQIAGTSIQAVLRCENSLLSDILDRFGLDTMLHDNGDGTFDAVVTAEPEGLKFWAVQYLERCEIRKPQRLRRELAQTLREGWELYRAPLASFDDHQMMEEEMQDE